MSNENTLPAPDNRPAVGGTVERQVRPPVGLRPESIAEYLNCRNRLIEIAEAMTRYAEAEKPVPPEWCRELERRIENYVPSRREREA